MANRITTTFDFQERGQGLKKIKADVAEVDGAWNKAKKGAQGAWAEFAGSRAAQAAVAGLAIKIGKDAVIAASNLEESLNAVNVTYGESAAAVTKLGETSAESFGLSQRAFNEFAVQFSSFAQNIAGRDGRAVSDVVQEMTGRVADFASVMNLDVSEAARVFQSALAGETEPIKKFGIDMSAAAVEAYALANGLAASKSELTEGVKVQARYGLLMEATAKTSGDFKKTQDGLANSSRTLTAQFEDLQAKLGEQLLPIVSDTTASLVDMVSVANQLAETIQATGDKIPGWAQDLNNLVGPGFLKDVAIDKPLDLLSWGLDKVGMSAEDTAFSIDKARESYYQQAYAAGRLAPALDDAAESVVSLEDRQKNAAAAADTHRRKLRDLADQIGGLKKEIDDRQAWLRLQDTFADVVSQGINVANMSREQEMAVNDLKLEVLDYADSINLPERVVTEILAEIDEGRLSEVESLLQRWGRGITIPIRPSVIATSSGGSILTEGGRRVGARASGGPVNAGQTYLVGERGPELVTMGRSGYVLPNHALGAASGSVTIGQVVVQAPAGANADEFGRAVREAIRRETRWSGPVTGWSAA